MKDRPETLKSIVTCVPTGLGKLYIKISELDSGDPIEVICTIGKSGSSVMAKAEVTGRLITLALHYRIPLAEIVEQLIDISGKEQIPWHDTVIKSIPDAVGKALQSRYLENT